jgi:hypothetical protein
VLKARHRKMSGFFIALPGSAVLLLAPTVINAIEPSTDTVSGVLNAARIHLTCVHGEPGSEAPRIRQKAIPDSATEMQALLN